MEYWSTATSKVLLALTPTLQYSNWRQESFTTGTSYEKKIDRDKRLMNNGQSKKHILSMLVDNEPGVLSRVAGLFSGRGFNIDSLCVSETTDPLVSRITLVAVGDMSILEQIKKQLNKLVNVIKVMDFTEADFVQRETALVKVRAKPENRAEILRMADIFRSTVVDVGTEYYTLEVTGDDGKISAFLKLLKPMGIKEIARTGPVALAREKK
jgi:acetolactate synthase-1/3 small subunit